MKKRLLALAALSCCLTLVSWFETGHRTVAKIADNHLTPQAKAGIVELLGNETMAQASTWADEVKSSPQYKVTEAWHFLNLPLGLSFDEFAQKIKGMDNNNIYAAIIRCEHVLEHNTNSKNQRIIALKLLIHLVGDAHQPMHVSRMEDKGGNNIAVKYNNQYTDLHSLWDGKMIEHQGLNYMEMAAKYDTATPEAIKKWQADSPMIWLWESYQISSQLYTEMEENNNLVGEDYYQSHMPLIAQRIEKGGIRLAGVLNAIYNHQDMAADTVKHK